MLIISLIKRCKYLHSYYACVYICRAMKERKNYKTVPEFAKMKGVKRDTINKIIQRGALLDRFKDVKRCNKIGRYYIIEL